MTNPKSNLQVLSIIYRDDFTQFRIILLSI